MDITFLSKTRFFSGVSEADIAAMLSCLDAKTEHYSKGEMIFREGDKVSSLGMVLSGSVHIEHIDYWGNTAVMNRISAGAIFGETYACTGQPIMVDAVACEKSEILFMNVSKVLTACTNAYAHHAALIQNLLSISAQKNIQLSQRMFHTSFKSIRARLISYFSEQEKLYGSTFTIPFNRQQLADYLNVDRSAMSNEISKMSRDGIITVNKNTFTLLGS